MLVLFETAAGYAVFKLLDEKKLQEADNLYLDFESPDKASKVVKLKHFAKFNDTTEALAAITASVEGKMGKSLKKLLKKVVVKEAHEQLLVSDAKLGGLIKDKTNMQCVCNSAVHELMRGIRSQIDSLITGIGAKELSAMSLGLAHSLSRYKLKFSPDKVDTMIVQAISLLDDLDKELNNYVMRGREWYGWHFPEMGKIISDNLTFAKVVRKIGDRTKTASTDLSDLVPEELEKEVKEAAEISMGTEVSEEDIENISYLCDQIIEITDYRTQLYDYLNNRMIAIAPNLTALVGELVGARLIAHAGSLMNLAKHPSSTVQILGAEKALFRALKTKHETPKYGLIYHAALVGQSNAQNKGKISRMLAAKTSLAIRVDALGEDSNAEMGIEHRAKLEIRLRMLEEQSARTISGSGRKKAASAKYDHKGSAGGTYDTGADSTLPTQTKKRKLDETTTTTTPLHNGSPSKKKLKLEAAATTPVSATTPKSEKKTKKKKSEADSTLETSVDVDTSLVEKPKKKMKKEKNADSTIDTTQDDSTLGSPSIEKKKKKKKKGKPEVKVVYHDK